MERTRRGFPTPLILVVTTALMAAPMFAGEAPIADAVRPGKPYVHQESVYNIQSYF